MARHNAASEEDKLIHDDILLALVKQKLRIGKEVSGLNGDYGRHVLFHQENSGLHRGALAVITKLAKLDELKRDGFLRQLNHYVSVMDKKDWDAERHAGDLVDMAEASAKADEEATKPAKATKTALSPEEARAAFEANQHKAPAPGVPAGIKKPARTQSDKDTVDEFRKSLKGVPAENLN